MASLRMTLKIRTLLFYMFLTHGITENDTENMDTAVLHVNNELDLNEITIDEIQRSHRLGPKRLGMNTRLKD